jgi:choline kinase
MKTRMRPWMYPIPIASLSAQLIEATRRTRDELERLSYRTILGYLKWSVSQLQILIGALEMEMEKWEEYEDQRQWSGNPQDTANNLQNRWRELDQMKKAARVT